MADKIYKNLFSVLSRQGWTKSRVISIGEGDSFRPFFFPAVVILTR